MTSDILEPPTLPQGTVQKTRTQPLVARGLHQETRIELYNVTHGTGTHASVMIYPARYRLREEQVADYYPLGASIQKGRASREYKDASSEKVNHVFLHTIKPLIPFMTQEHQLYETRVIDHQFPEDARRFLEEIINDLEI